MEWCWMSIQILGTNFVWNRKCRSPGQPGLLLAWRKGRFSDLVEKPWEMGKNWTFDVFSNSHAINHWPPLVSHPMDHILAWHGPSPWRLVSVVPLFRSTCRVGLAAWFLTWHPACCGWKWRMHRRWKSSHETPADKESFCGCDDRNEAKSKVSCFWEYKDTLTSWLWVQALMQRFKMYFDTFGFLCLLLGKNGKNSMEFMEFTNVLRLWEFLTSQVGIQSMSNWGRLLLLCWRMKTCKFRSRPTSHGFSMDRVESSGHCYMI